MGNAKPVFEQPPTGTTGIDLGFDSAGNGFFLFMQSTGTLRIARRSAGPAGTFGSADTVSSGHTILHFAIVVDPNGRALLAWIEADGAGGNGSVKARVWNGATEDFLHPTETIFDNTSGSSVISPRPVLDDAGSAVIAFHPCCTSPGMSPLRQAVATDVTLADAFAPSTELVADIGPLAPAAQNSAGRAALVWSQNDAPNERTATGTRQPGEPFAVGVRKRGRVRSGFPRSRSPRAARR